MIEAHWTGREPCRNPANDPDWWMAEPLPGDSMLQRAAKYTDRERAQALCQDCPHASWVACARIGLAGGDKTFGVHGGVWVPFHDTRHKGEREEAIAELTAIAATGLPTEVKVVRHHGRHPALSATQIVEANEMRTSGMTYMAIGAKLGVSHSTVSHALRAQDGYVPVARVGLLDAAKIAQAREMHNSGIGYKKIGRALGVCHSTVYRALKVGAA